MKLRFGNTKNFCYRPIAWLPWEFKDGPASGIYVTKPRDEQKGTASLKNKQEPDRTMDGVLEVTPRASQLMREHFKDKKKVPLRLFVKLGGCGIRSFGVALEKPKNSDHVFEIEEFQYIVDKVLLERFQPIKVDSDGFGFRISGSGIAPHHGCGNCGFMCGDGNRCSGDCATCSFQCGHSRGLRNAK